MWTRKSWLLLLVALVGLAGCAMSRHREQVRQGFLTRGLHRGAFLKEWGPPDRTFTLPSRERVVRQRWFGATWEYAVFEVWEYRARATCLTFDRVRLVAWQTGRTDCTPKVPKEEPERKPSRRAPPPYPPYPE